MILEIVLETPTSNVEHDLSICSNGRGVAHLQTSSSSAFAVEELLALLNLRGRTISNIEACTRVKLMHEAHPLRIV